MVRCLGNPADIENFPCDEDLRLIMASSEITWTEWSTKIKHSLLRHLFDEFTKRKIQEFPSYRHIQVFQSFLHINKVMIYLVWEEARAILQKSIGVGQTSIFYHF